MRSGVFRLGLSCWATFIALLVASTPASGAPKPISGKLSKPGYTVIALAANGEANAKRAKRGNFKLRPPANRVSLHLRSPDGTYAGPIVVDRERKGKRAIIGVRSGAELGRIDIRARKGFGRVAKQLPEESIDRDQFARARRGVPIGAAVFGRVRSKPSRGAVPADQELDGIHDRLDVDDDGDLVLDNFDRSGKKKGRRANHEPSEFQVQSSMFLSLSNTVNANAGAVTTAQIDAALSTTGLLSLRQVPGDVEELDCGHPTKGLAYCRKQNSTGEARTDPAAFPEHWDGSSPFATSPFPSCCDPDNDGFGTFVQFPNASTPTMLIGHGATSAQIGTGDVLIERVITGGVETQVPATINFVFATVVALASYDDGQGNAATIPYPVAPGDISPEGLPVEAGPDGNVVVTLTFWRPQRRPIPPETAEWIDLGGLAYTAQASGEVQGGCPQSAFSVTHPELVAGAPWPDSGGFRDLAADRPADPANTFTFTLNLTDCMAAHGGSFEPGQSHAFTFVAITGHGDLTHQSVTFKRQ